MTHSPSLPSCGRNGCRMLRLTLVACGLAAATLAAGPRLAAEEAPAPQRDAAEEPAEPERHLLRYAFVAGEVLRWDVTHRSRVRTSVSGTTKTADTSSQSVKAWEVREVAEDGTATFVYSVESVDMRHTIDDGEEVRFNSQTDGAVPPGFDHLARSLNVPLAFVKMDARGEIVEKSALPADASVIGEGTMTLPLPEEPVAVGDSWTRPQEIIVPLETGVSRRVQLVQRCTLEAVRTGVATIRVANQILTPIHSPELEAKLVQRQTQGTVRFDVDAGRVIAHQMDLDRRVFGFRGETSSIHYVSRFQERFLPEQSETGEEAAHRTAAREPVARASR